MSDHQSDRSGDPLTAAARQTDHGFVWTADRIAAFWDTIAAQPRFDDTYFSKQVSAALVKLVSWFVEQRQRNGFDDPTVLDYGCGPGYSTEAFLRAGFRTAALEFSPGSVQAVRDRIESNELATSKYLGVTLADRLPSALPDGQFDVVISTEAYEHLLSDWVEGFFAELYRLTAPSGFAIVTTPAAERLDDNLCLCPNCHASFHRWGHLRSVTPESFGRDAEAVGWDVKRIQALRLESLQPRRGAEATIRRVASTSPKDLVISILATLRSTRSMLSGRPRWWSRIDRVPAGGNLVMILQKTNRA